MNTSVSSGECDVTCANCQGTTVEELQNASSERVFDSLPTLSTGSEEFDGSGELEECLLKLLHCGKCGRKLGVKCVGAPDEKVHHRNNCFFKDSRISLRAAGDVVPLNVVASTTIPTQTRSLSRSETPSSRPRTSFEVRAKSDSLFESFDGAVSATPQPITNGLKPLGGSISEVQDSEATTMLDTSDPKRVSSGMMRFNQNNTPKLSGPSTITLQADEPEPLERQLQEILNSQAADIRRILIAVEMLQKEMTAVKDSVNRLAAGSMLPPSTAKRRMELREPAEISDSSRESSRPREASSARPVKFAKTKHASSEVAAAILRLRGQREPGNDGQLQQGNESGPTPTMPRTAEGGIVPSTIPQVSEIITKTSKPTVKFPKDTIGELGSAGRPTAAFEPSNPSDQISRETQEYLDKAVVEDPRDMDYMPSNPSASVSVAKLPMQSHTESNSKAEDSANPRKPSDEDATESVLTASDSSKDGPPQEPIRTPQKASHTIRDVLSSPARPIESLSQQSMPHAQLRGRGGARPGAGRPRKSLAVGDGRLTPEWEREDWDPDTYAAKMRDPAYKSPYHKSKPPPSKAIARRGVSRGGLARFTRIESHVGSPHWSAKGQNGGRVRSRSKARDAEGFLLMANGKRDGRSLRQKRNRSSLQPQLENKGSHETGGREEEGDTIELQRKQPEEQANIDPPVKGEEATMAIEDPTSNTADGNEDERARVQNQVISDNHAKLMAKVFRHRYQ